MANVGLTFPATMVPFPFDTSELSAPEKTAAPRARLLFRTVGEVVTAKSALDTTSVVVTNTLPPNYVYVIEHAHCVISFATDLDDADHFSNAGIMTLSIGDALGNRFEQLLSEGTTPFGLNAGSQKVWGPKDKYPMPIYNTRQSGLSISLSVWDTDLVNATQAGSLSSVVSVLQYDLEQVYNLGLNFPLPVQVR